MKQQILYKLLRIAEKLDSKNCSEEADELADIVTKLAEMGDIDPIKSEVMTSREALSTVYADKVSIPQSRGDYASYGRDILASMEANPETVVFLNEKVVVRGNTMYDEEGNPLIKFGD